MNELLKGLGLVRGEVKQEVVELPPGASPLDFLVAVYSDSEQPFNNRLRAAVAAAPFMHPKVNVSANVDKEEFAKMMEEIGRNSGKSNVIDSKPRRLTQVIETDPAKD